MQTATSVRNIPREVAVDVSSHLSGKADPLELALGHALLPLGVRGQLVLRRDAQRVVPAISHVSVPPALLHVHHDWYGTPMPYLAWLNIVAQCQEKRKYGIGYTQIPQQSPTKEHAIPREHLTENLQSS